MNSKNFCATIALLSSLLISCSKDEPDTTFEGTWILQATEQRNCDDSSDNSAKNSDFVSNTPCTNEPTIICSYEKYIFENGAFSKTTTTVLLGLPISTSTAGTFVLNDSRLELCVEEGPAANKCSDASMKIDGNTLILTTLEQNTGCTKNTFYRKQ